MARKQKIRKVLATKIEYLDPISCQSTVGYAICQYNKQLDAEITLTDCNRKIVWSFGGRYNGGLEKIDRAIEILDDFRVDFAEALKNMGEK